MIKKVVLLLLLLSVYSAWSLPSVTDINITQRSDRYSLTITYTLDGDEPAIVTLGITTNDVPISANLLTSAFGDINKIVEPGNNKTIIVYPDRTLNGQVLTNANALLTVWTTSRPPDYMVVDLSSGPTGSKYEVNFYPSADALPFGGVTNDLYKTVLLPFRYIQAGSFWMGASPYEPTYATGHNGYLHKVTLTNDYYIGVYEVTQAQWCQIANTKPSGWAFPKDAGTRPVELVSYLKIRECAVNANVNTEIDWPHTGMSVGAGSFADLLRQRTGFDGFDLPTDAQWEYAARADTLRSINILGGINVTNIESDANLDLAGRYKYNGGWGPNNDTDYINKHATYGAMLPNHSATAKVGSYLPNSWGLYDTQGNVSEWTRDYYTANLGSEPVIEPLGAASGNRVARGMCFWHTATASRISARLGWGPANAGSHVGVRMACEWH